jgi:hypothetical protein
MEGARLKRAGSTFFLNLSIVKSRFPQNVGPEADASPLALEGNRRVQEVQ